MHFDHDNEKKKFLLWPPAGNLHFLCCWILSLGLMPNQLYFKVNKVCHSYMSKVSKVMSLTTMDKPFSRFFLKPRPEVRVKMTKKQYVTLRDHKMYLHTKFRIPTWNEIQICSRLDLSQIEARSQDQSYMETVGDTSQPKDVSTFGSYMS